MKHPRTARRPKNCAQFLNLETLELRTLLSGVVSPLAQLPNESTLTNPTFSNEWYLNNTGQAITNASMGPSTGKAGADINATDAWDLTTGSSNVVVAVFDTGTDLSNPDLAANIWTNPGIVTPGFTNDIHGWNFIDNNNNVQDTTGHGTTTNGVIGAVGNNGQGIAGIAWNVKLLEVKVGDASGVTDANLQAGINYVIALKNEGVNIVAINASYFSVGALSLSDFNSITAAGNAGLLYIAASGNSSLNLDSFIPKGFLPSNMIFVAATDAQDNLASFSDFGANSVQIAAPGVDITTTVFDGFDATLSGTSYSAPMVSGTIALMKSLDPAATMAQLKSALFTGADVDPAITGKVTYGRLDAYKSLELLQGDVAPVGNVDVLNSTTVTGWAYDANAGLKPAIVSLAIDGKIVQTTSASLDREDLTASLGSPDHGFAFTMPALSGTHTIQIIVRDFSPFLTPMASVYLATQVLTTAAPPNGWLDIANATTVAGWAIDQDTPSQSVTMQFFIDGQSVGSLPANANRPDLIPIYGSANHGFSFTLPTLTATFHRLDVYALDTTTNNPTLIASRTLNANIPATGFIDNFNGTLLQGWALDPDTASTSIQIEYSIDGNAPTLAAANTSRPDLIPLYGSANHGFSISLPELGPGTHTVAVSAVDPDTGALIPLGTKSTDLVYPFPAETPKGVIDVATTTSVKGWAFESDLGSGPVSVRIDVDGVTGTPFLANLNRPDLTPAVGSPNHGFSQTLSLAPGEHTLDLYAISGTSGPTIFLGQKIVGQAPPTGWLDVANISVIAGWAYSPGAATGPVTVQLTIDGVAGPITSADLTRNDLTPVVGSPNHGFSFTTPNLAPGSHKITLAVLDPVTLQPTTLLTGALVT